MSDAAKGVRQPMLIGNPHMRLRHEARRTLQGRQLTRAISLPRRSNLRWNDLHLMPSDALAGVAFAQQKKLAIRACKPIMHCWLLRIDARIKWALCVKELRLINADLHIEVVGARRSVSTHPADRSR